MKSEKNRLQSMISGLLSQIQVADIHTHLYYPAFEGIMLRGIDELLVYHYLVAEALRIYPEKTAEFWGLSLKEQADFVWRTLFVERSPVSESCRGVLTVLSSYGLDLETRDLDAYRDFFAGLSIEEHVEMVFEKAKLRYLVMTNNPFDPEEREYWQEDFVKDPRFRAALRIDPLLNDWPGAVPQLQADGYKVEKDFTGRTFTEIRRFLEDWTKRMDPLYLSVTLPPDFSYPESTPRGRLLKEVILPFCAETNRPFAPMPGVKKLLNPKLRLAGDSVGKSSIEAIERLCLEHPEVKFLVTILSRENQHELAVTARKFGNLMIFGCWWFLNNPSLIQEMTRMRLELLGLSFIPQHSDARVLDQLIYKWRHSKELIAEILADKYEDLAATGWKVTEEEIRRDLEWLFYRNFEEFLGIS